MNLIVATDEKWGIGRDGGLLAHLSSDLKYFKEKTMGKTVVMGRRTLESLPGSKPLPHRKNVVLTGNLSYEKEGCTVVHTMEELKELCSSQPGDEVMIIGGASLYNALMEECESLYITKIYADLGADVFIKNVDELTGFEVCWQSEILEENDIRFQFLEYKRVEDGKEN